MLRRSPVLAVAALVAASFLAACGTSSGSDAAEDPTTTAAKATTTEAEATDTTEAEATDTTEADEPSGDDEICTPLKVLSDFDIDSAEVINGGDWAAVQAFFVENTEPVLEAYDEAIAMDSEVTADLEALRSVTESTSELAAESSDLMDLSGRLMAQPGMMEAGEAGLRLNTFAEETCGFSTGGNGQ